VAVELAARRSDLLCGPVLSGSSVNFRGALGVYLSVVAGLMRRGGAARRLPPPGADPEWEPRCSVGARRATTFAAGLARRTVRSIPDAGHACNLDQPAAHSATIREFAESLDWT